MALAEKYHSQYCRFKLTRGVHQLELENLLFLIPQRIPTYIDFNFIYYSSLNSAHLNRSKDISSPLVNPPYFALNSINFTVFLHSAAIFASDRTNMISVCHNRENSQINTYRLLSRLGEVGGLLKDVSFFLSKEMGSWEAAGWNTELAAILVFWHPALLAGN